MEIIQPENQPPEMTPERIAGFKMAGETLDHYGRNRLALVVGYSELLSEDPELNERLQSMALDVISAAREIEQIIKLITSLDSQNITFKTDSPTGRPYVNLDDKIK